MGKTLEDKLAFTKMIAEMKGIDMVVLQGPVGTSREKPAVILFYPCKDYSDATTDNDVSTLIRFFNRSLSAKMNYEIMLRFLREWGKVDEEGNLKT